MSNTFKAICINAADELVGGQEYICEEAGQGLVKVEGGWGRYYKWRFEHAGVRGATTPAPTTPEATVAPAEGLAGTLAARGSRYGSFAVNGQIAQDIKAVMRGAPKWGVLTGAQQEALDMFASKISRILTGDPDYLDNWHDIAGYATRIEELLKEQA